MWDEWQLRMHLDYAEVFSNPANWASVGSPVTNEEKDIKHHERRIRRLQERFEKRGGFAVPYEYHRRQQ